LTDKIRRQPYSLVLFDEIEKAHPDVFNMMLQILEDGYLTDAKGRKIDFTNTIVIMTSNIGADKLQKEANLGFHANDRSAFDDLDEMHSRNKDKVHDELKKVMRPEFLNRIDKVIASPKWSFDDTTFARSAAAFGNPDHVDIVIHNYRWRLGLAEGEPKYAGLEKRLAEFPIITVPTITLESDANGAPHPDPKTYAKKFVGKYEHRHIDRGIGHNLPQEAPKPFVDAIIDVAQA
jgi:pimeloyl-ACP methyl ester carboxylesterase